MTSEPDSAAAPVAVQPAAVATAGWRPRWRRWGPYPFELVTLVAVLLAAGALRSRGLRMDWQTFDYIVTPALRLLPKALVAGIALQLVYRALLRLPLVAYLRAVARPRWALLWVRLLVAAVLMTYGYFWLKVAVPLVNPRLWDDALWRVDRTLHFGISPSVFVANLFAGTPLVPWIDRWYGSWVSTVFYTLVLFAAALDPLLRRQFLLSCVLLWTFGSWLYVAVPALGPVYVVPAAYQDVLEQMPRAQAGQAVLRENYQRMLEGRRSGKLASFKPTRGIAAMPSLHVGAHFLFFLWARRRARPLRLVFALATFFTFAGSLLTGWHYAVDGYVGLLLAWACFRLALLMEAGGEEEPDPAFPAPRPRAAEPAAARVVT
jgi:hypothetical protein